MNNSPTPSHQIVRLSDSAMKMIDPDIHGIYRVSERAGFLIGAASAIAVQSCPTLTIGEWCALAAAANGHYYTYESGVEQVLESLWCNLYDTAYEANKHYSVDCEHLAKRLNKMPLAQQLAVFEIVRKFWIRTETEVSESFAERFTRLGAPGLL